MTAYLDSYFKNFTAIERKLVVSAVDVNTGSYTTFTEEVGLEDLGTVIRASASIPFVFEPTAYRGGLYMDGGTTWNINLKDAVDRCLEVVDDESHVVLDIVMTEFINLKKWKSSGKPLTNFWRSHQIKKFYHVMNDVVEFAKSRPKVNYRHFFKPDKKFGGWWSELKFDNSTTWDF